MEPAAASVAALPFAAALTLLLAWASPIHFAYRPNAYGIVSVVTQLRYPHQQETFWLIFGVGVASLLTWLLARGAALRVRDGAAVLRLEALGVAGLLAVLFLPLPLGAAVCLAALVAAGLLASRAPTASPPARAPASVPVPAQRRTPLGLAAWGLGVVALAPLLSWALWGHLWSVASGVPDAALTQDNFKFLGEMGQHLAWANAVLKGGFQGRDFFCLYGPLYDLGLVGFWKLVGRSVAAWYLYWGLSRLCAWLILFALAGSLLRHRVFLLLLPFLLPWIELRVGLPLLGLLCLVPWLRGAGRAWCAAAGVAAGVALFYSQEYATAFVLAAAVGFAVRRDLRAALLFGGAAAVAISPLLAWFAAHGALVPMLRDVVLYPHYMIAGYGNLPFVSLLAELPLDPSAWLRERASLELRQGYAVPAVSAAALLLALPITSLDPRRLLVSLREAAERLTADPVRLATVLIAIFGLVSFRSALGRSSLQRIHAAMPAAALLLCLAVDRIATHWRAGGEGRRVAARRAALLAGFVALGGFTETSNPVAAVMKSAETISRLVRFDYRPRGSRRVMRVTRWVQLHTDPSEPVLFLPNDPAYYYLTDRPNPIRFVQGHQIVSDAHRKEVLASLRERPPRYVVWDHRALRVDDISDELVFGEEILDWLRRSYVIETQLNEVDFLRHVDSDPGRG